MACTAQAAMRRCIGTLPPLATQALVPVTQPRTSLTLCASCATNDLRVAAREDAAAILRAAACFGATVTVYLCDVGSFCERQRQWAAQDGATVSDSVATLPDATVAAMHGHGGSGAREATPPAWRERLVAMVTTARRWAGWRCALVPTRSSVASCACCSYTGCYAFSIMIRTTHRVLEALSRRQGATARCVRWRQRSARSSGGLAGRALCFSARLNIRQAPGGASATRDLIMSVHRALKSRLKVVVLLF